MRGLDEDIKNHNFKPAYLLFGNEEYLKTHYGRSLVNAMSDPDDTMNRTVFEGKDIDVAKLIDLAETMPFFKDRRLVVVKNSGFFKKATDELADYLKEPCDTTCFIFIEQEVDKRGRMYKAVTNLGRAVEMVTPDVEVLIRWMAGLLKKNGKQVRRSTLERLIARSGMDMNLLYGEIEKLTSYTGDRDTIEDADVDEICTLDVKGQVFTMVDAIADGKSKKALELYYDLLALKERPLNILFLIARQFNLMLQAKELMQTIRDRKLLGEVMGLKPTIAGMYADRARRFSMQYLRQAVSECAQLEEASKSGRMNDQMAVELLIIKYSKQR